ncbi:hypothetical protein QR680_018574 [Steinernema hermaphroditum]|uniref:non-specific serine/threonine protein kinase n=1 Tax=Steinernema hermaphroditum TaxID=289476 RepID=A0AA39LR21_9BILA|nr:hypothetical protein QR680_018574 [Steinernema hermaphroditum]
MVKASTVIRSTDKRTVKKTIKDGELVSQEQANNDKPKGGAGAKEGIGSADEGPKDLNEELAKENKACDQGARKSKKDLNEAKKAEHKDVRILKSGGGKHRKISRKMSADDEAAAAENNEKRRISVTKVKLKKKTKKKTSVQTEGCTDNKIYTSGAVVNTNKRNILSTDDPSIELTVMAMYDKTCKLGSGAFGDVYKVSKLPKLEIKDVEYAMKTEDEKGKDKLKLECDVIAAVAKMFVTKNKPKLENFANVYAYGLLKGKGLRAMVMDVVGPSIDDYRKKRSSSFNYSGATAVRISMKMIDPIMQLHSAGYIHRDIKPANFCIGLDTNDDQVFMLDFGIAYRYVVDDKVGHQLIPFDAKKRLPFAGTLPFCSRACMMHRMLSRADDLECWLYTLFDLCDRHLLPWKRVRDFETVRGAKEVLFDYLDEGESYDKVYEKFRDFEGCAKLINDLKFTDEPDYRRLKKILIEEASKKGIDITQPYDWTTTTDSKESKKEPKMRSTTPRTAKTLLAGSRKE